MGTLYEFKCSCGYRAEVSGGGDAGMFCSTVTILCETCRRVFDVTDKVIEQDGSFKSVPLACPRAGKGKHLINKWSSNHLCPRCGQKMRKGDAGILWD